MFSKTIIVMLKSHCSTIIIIIIIMQRLKYYVYDIIQREKYKKLHEVKCFEQSAAWEFGWQGLLSVCSDPCQPNAHYYKLWIFLIWVSKLKISKFKKNQNSLLFWNKSHFLQLNTHYVHKHEPSQRSYHLEVIFLDCGCLYCHSLVSISVNQKCFNLVGITISKDSTSSSAGIVCLFSKNVYRIKNGCVLSNRHIKPVSDKQKLKILLSIV